MAGTDGRVAVVTGAGSGVGRATAEALAERGLRVVCVGRRAAALRETADLIGDAAVVVPADVAREGGIAAVRDVIAGQTVATIVHAAGIEGLLPFAGTARSAFDALIATNLGGPFFLTQALVPSFADGGSVVFVGSVAAVRGRDRHAAYAASKAGLLGLTVNLAAELAPRVRVNCVCLGAVQTPMFEKAVRDYFSGIDEADAQRVAVAEGARMLLGVAQPAHVAGSIVYLALDARFSTGTVLHADGGYTAR